MLDLASIAEIVVIHGHFLSQPHADLHQISLQLKYAVYKIGGRRGLQTYDRFGIAH